jgi:hypothetical protein
LIVALFSGRENNESQSPSFFEKLESRELLSAVPIAAKIKVAMATDSQGVALNSSTITVRFTENINLIDSTKFRMFGYSINTASGSGTAQQKTTINLTSVVPGADGNKLVFTTDRRVRKGARLIMFPGAITNTSDGTSIGDQEPLMPKGLNKERYTLACRAFNPTVANFFDPALYPKADPLVTTPNLPSTSSVTNALTSYLNKEVTAGTITSAQKTQALGIYNDATITSEFPSANMRAGLASLVGTVAEDAINQYTTSANVTGKPFTVVDFSTEVSNSAVVAETTGNVTTKRIRTLFKTSFKGESFLTLAPFLAHEAIHQDIVGADPALQDGVKEEEFAVTVETMIWAQELNIDPTPASGHTELATHLNADLLAILNSGIALFPRVGELAAPILGANALPGATVSDGMGAYTSFQNYISRIYQARNFSNAETPGNDYARTVQNNITGRTDTTNFTFSDARISIFDNSQQVISDKLAVKVAGVLKLKITA